MPIFKMPKVSPGLSITTDDDVLHFLNPDNKSKYVDARIALKNSDIYSLIYQLSSDIADAKFVAESSRTQGILNNPTTECRGFLDDSGECKKSLSDTNKKVEEDNKQKNY